MKFKVFDISSLDVELENELGVKCRIPRYLFRDFALTPIIGYDVSIDIKMTKPMHNCIGMQNMYKNPIEADTKRLLELIEKYHAKFCLFCGAQI